MPYPNHSHYTFHFFSSFAVRVCYSSLSVVGVALFDGGAISFVVGDEGGVHQSVYDSRTCCWYTVCGNWYTVCAQSKHGKHLILNSNLVKINDTRG